MITFYNKLTECRLHALVFESITDIVLIVDLFLGQDPCCIHKYIFNPYHGNMFRCYHATDISGEHESLITSSYIQDESCYQGV